MEVGASLLLSRRCPQLEAQLAMREAQQAAMEERLAFLEAENTDLRAQLVTRDEREVESADLRSQNTILRARVQVLTKQVRDSARQQQRPRGSSAKKYRARRRQQRRSTAPGQAKALRLPLKQLGGENYPAAALDGR